MWSDNDIDNAFRRLNPPEPEPSSFPLDAWLRLENELDKAAIERTVRRRLWKFFAAEIAVVLVAALSWLAWPTATTTQSAGAKPKAADAPVASAVRGGAAMRPDSRPAGRAASAGALPASEAMGSATASATLTPIAPVAAAAETADSFSDHQAAASAILPAPKTSTLRATRGPQAVVAAVSSPSRRTSGVAKTDLQRTTLPLAIQTRPTRSVNDIRRMPMASASLPAAQLAAGQGSSTAQRPDWHSAAGSIAAPAEAPTQAVVAATSRLRQHRMGQSPVLTGQAGDMGTAPHSATAIPVFAALEDASSSSIVALPIRTPAVLLPADDMLPGSLATTAVTPPITQQEQVQPPRFYVGLVAAPDVSTVGFFGVERPTPNVGVVLEYRLTHRLRVSTGLLRSTKEYVARRDDYNWGAYSKLVYSYNFDDVYGSCTVLDVPLNLRYDFVARPQYRVFGSVGLSSFFMQREHYYYDWTDYSGFHAWNGYAVNQNQHLLSILNLSVGFERSLGRHWSLQAEPYAKLPMAGVGLGKVRLTSGGVFFGLKYGF